MHQHYEDLHNQSLRQHRKRVFRKQEFRGHTGSRNASPSCPFRVWAVTRQVGDPRRPTVRKLGVCQAPRVRQPRALTQVPATGLSVTVIVQRWAVTLF